jgi:Protein of unknown function (DUF3108)
MLCARATVKLARRFGLELWRWCRTYVRMRYHILLLAALALAIAAPARATPWTATYEFHAAGLRVLEAEFTFDVDGPQYRLEVHSRSRGLFNVFARNEQTTSVSGRWEGDTPRPERYRVRGAFRGQSRIVDMDFAPDGMPRLGALEPSNATDMREEIPRENLAGTIDALSAVAQLSRIVARTERCEADARMYDARRLTRVHARTIGTEAVPADWREGLRGMALRCEVESVLLGGWRTDQDIERARQPVVTTVWIARPVAEAPPVPLRLELATRWWGRLHGVLTKIERAAP